MTDPPQVAAHEEPPAPDATAIEEGRVLFAGACDFVTSAQTPAGVPALEPPEIAFAGPFQCRKNRACSNALTGRRSLARTSQTPGRTRQINFFVLAERLVLADLPGYGFARAPKREIARWTALVRRYLVGRANLRRCCLLIDARRGAQQSDRDVMALMDEAAVSYQVILTKSDKVKPGAAARRAAALRDELKAHAAAYPSVLLTSAVSGEGIAELRATLATLARAP